MQKNFHYFAILYCYRNVHYFISSKNDVRFPNYIHAGCSSPKCIQNSSSIEYQVLNNKVYGTLLQKEFDSLKKKKNHEHRHFKIILFLVFLSEIKDFSFGNQSISAFVLQYILPLPLCNQHLQSHAKLNLATHSILRNKRNITV